MAAAPPTHPPPRESLTAPPTAPMFQPPPAAPPAAPATAAPSEPLPPPPPRPRQPALWARWSAALRGQAFVASDDGGAAACQSVRGWTHRRERLVAVWQLAAVWVVVALFGMAPAWFEMAEFFQSSGDIPIARWAFAMVFVGAVQLLYAVLLVQAPDWSSVWIVTLVGLAMATTYAVLLSLALLGQPDNEVLAWLQLREHVDDGRAVRWCFVMLSTTSVFTWFAGRMSVRWRVTDRKLAGLSPS